jgi:hypothetical protein
MIELIEGLPKNVVGIVARGRVTMQDCQDVLVPAIKRSRKRHDKIRLYYEINSRFPGSAWDDLDLGLEHAACCERVAIVTDISWVRSTVKAVRFLIPSKIRVFPTILADEGRAWITARPGSREDRDISVPDPLRSLLLQLRKQESGTTPFCIAFSELSRRAKSRRARHFQPTRRPSRASQPIA